MRTVSFDPQLLRKHLLRHKIATLPELKQALGATANLTVFRKLKLLDYLPATPIAAAIIHCAKSLASMTPASGRTMPSGSLGMARSSPPLSPSSVRLLADGSLTSWLMPYTPRYRTPSTIWPSAVVCADPTWPVDSCTLLPIAGYRGIRSVPGKRPAPCR